MKTLIRNFRPLIGSGLSLLFCMGFFSKLNAVEDSQSMRPNVLFLAVDDMNDWASVLGGYRGKVHTPNMERLADKGLLFTNAHCPSPSCNPSRTAILTGLLPTTTGIYGNRQPWIPHLPDVTVLPAHFKSSGYLTVGAGKIFHHGNDSNPREAWHDFRDLERVPKPPDFPANGIADRASMLTMDWKAMDILDEEMSDGGAARWTADFLGKKHDKPFFLACGIFRPHLPWYTPKQYFDLYPLQDIVLPKVREDDLNDVPPAGREVAAFRRIDHELIAEGGLWKQAIQAYLASISFADAQIGLVLDALETSPYVENTIILLWSDHGWHLGEKKHWHKYTLWERGTRVPFMIAVPGVTSEESVTNRPVSLLDIFPTLIELCNLPELERLDGRSLVPLLRNPNQDWDYPVLISMYRGQFAVRSERWRYIRYPDGSEELYDHQIDPNEWNNLAGQPGMESIKRQLAKHIPDDLAPDAPDRSEYVRDPVTGKMKLKGAVNN